MDRPILQVPFTGLLRDRHYPTHTAPLRSQLRPLSDLPLNYNGKAPCILTNNNPSECRPIGEKADLKPNYEAIIGLETHCQLSTETKTFCTCSTRFGADPNHNVCPICVGMPGVLPVLNKTVFDFASRSQARHDR